MAPNLITFVVLACACGTINTVSVLGKACRKIRKGSTAGFTHHLQPIILPQNHGDFELALPKCVGETNGVDVEACDNDRIPVAKFTEISTVVVHTTGILDTFIVVRMTLHCVSPQNQPSSGNMLTPLIQL